MITKPTATEIETLAAELFPNRFATHAEYETATINLDRARCSGAPESEIQQLANLASATYWSYADGIEAKAGK